MFGHILSVGSSILKTQMKHTKFLINQHYAKYNIVKPFHLGNLTQDLLLE